MEVLDESIYDHPKYYDLVFGSDVAAERRFILECGGKYLPHSRAKMPPTSWRLFEPACGTGRLIRAFAKLGFQASGLDLNHHAVKFCNERSTKHGLGELAFVADMCNFRLRRRFDIAFNTINSFRHVATEAAATAHLKCMADAARSGAIYLLGVHLTPTTASPSDGESWSARRGNLSINTHMWTIKRSPRKRMESYGIRFDIHTPSQSFRINDVLNLRSYTMKQMAQLIASEPRWTIEETFDFGYEIDYPIAVDSGTEDVVYVLKRQ